MDHGREESYKLLQEELSKLKEKPPERKEVLKVYQAMVVLQARQVLASLMAGWAKDGPRFSTSFLGNIDITQYFCLLDLLLKQLNQNQSEKVGIEALFRTLCSAATPSFRSFQQPSTVVSQQRWWGWHWLQLSVWGRCV